MKNLVVFLGCLFAANLCSASDATNILAEIVIDLNHFPSADDKTYLDEIIGDAESTDDEKLLAAIISRIAHKPDASDASALKKLAKSGSGEVKAIAAAVMSIEHKAAADKVAALETMLE